MFTSFIMWLKQELVYLLLVGQLGHVLEVLLRAVTHHHLEWHEELRILVVYLLILFVVVVYLYPAHLLETDQVLLALVVNALSD